MVKQKTRKDWRKSDVKDIEEAIEEERVAKDVSKKTDDELFHVDTVGSTKGLSRAMLKQVKKIKEVGPKQRRYSDREMLKVAKAARVLENRRKAAEHREAVAGPASTPELFDLWSTSVPVMEERKPSGVSGRLTQPAHLKAKTLPRHAPGTLHQRVSKAPAVLVAHGGQSINPESEAFEELVCTEAAVEVDKERESKILDQRRRPVTHALIKAYGDKAVRNMDEATRFKKFQELGRQRGNDGNKSSKSVSSAEAPGQTKMVGRKTMAQRNKKLRSKMSMQKLERERREKQLLKSVGGVGTLLKEISSTDKTNAEKRSHRQALREAEDEQERKHGKIPKRRKLGKYRYREAASEVPDLGDEGKERVGLRATKPNGSALQDRVQAIYRQGLLEMPPEATRGMERRVKKWKRREKKKAGKFVNPLLRDGSLLLR